MLDVSDGVSVEERTKGPRLSRRGEEIHGGDNSEVTGRSIVAKLAWMNSTCSRSILTFPPSSSCSCSYTRSSTGGAYATFSSFKTQVFTEHLQIEMSNTQHQIFLLLSSSLHHMVRHLSSAVARVEVF
jgi:hypothetical protein